MNLNGIKASFGVTFEKFRYEELDDGTVEITDCMLEDEKVIIPSEYKGRKVTSIGAGAFYGNESLVIVVIPEGVTNISQSAYYTVKAYDSENVSGCDTKGVSVIRAGQPDFTVSNGYSGINLNWTAVKGVNQYNIYRKTAQSTNWTKVVTVTGTSWTDTNVTNGSRYQYTVKAIIGSVMSTCHPGKTMYRLTSPVMSSLTEASSGTAVATWSKNAKATGYQLRYATKLDMTGTLTASNTTNSNAKTIFGLNKGTMYYVKLCKVENFTCSLSPCRRQLKMG